MQYVPLLINMTSICHSLFHERCVFCSNYCTRECFTAQFKQVVQFTFVVRGGWLCVAGSVGLVNCTISCCGCRSDDRIYAKLVFEVLVQTKSTQNELYWQYCMQWTHKFNDNWYRFENINDLSSIEVMSVRHRSSYWLTVKKSKFCIFFEWFLAYWLYYLYVLLNAFYLQNPFRVKYQLPDALLITGYCLIHAPLQLVNESELRHGLSTIR